MGILRQKKCKAPSCGKKFTPERQMQTCCNYQCGLEYARYKQIQKAAKQTVAKKHTKSPKQKAQDSINAYVRERDKFDPCISCRYDGAGRQMHAGHFRPVGSASQLRFNLYNINKQCERCNRRLSGNLVPYRENLIKKIGLKKVEWLETTNQVKKYNDNYYERIQKIFNKKTRMLKKRRAKKQAT